MSESKIDAESFLRLIHETIPLSRETPLEVLALEEGRARLVLRAGPEHIRAGGTLSGPTIMTLADTALYAAVLTAVGLEPMAVTSELSVRFLRRPPVGALIAEASLLRCGRRQAVGDVRMWSEEEGEAKLTAHAIGTYALPG